jgi:LTXXQ motif family protein
MRTPGFHGAAGGGRVQFARRCVAMTVMAVVCAPTASEARHHHRGSWNFNRPFVETPNDASWPNAAGSYYSRQRGRIADKGAPGVTLLLRQLADDCQREVLELKGFRAEPISQTVAANDDQNQLLAQLSKLAAEAGETLARSCPGEAPTSLEARLDTVEREMHAVQTAIDDLAPAMRMFTQSLSGDQRARLTAQVAPQRIDHQPSAPFPTRRKRSRTAAESFGGDPHPRLWDCERWQAALRSWPVWRVEEEIHAASRQRAALYEMAAVMQRAADALADACPQQSSTMPVDVMDETKRKTESLLQSMALIRPALNRFRDVLDDGQRAKLMTLM